MTQLGIVGQRVLAPAIAGGLLIWLNIGQIILLNATSFAIACLALWFLIRQGLYTQRVTAPWLRQIRESWAMIRHSALLRLCGYTVVSYFTGGFVIALATPIVLSIATPQTAGWVMGAIGSGMLVGNVLATRWTRTGGNVRRLLRYEVLKAAAMISILVFESALEIALAGFLFSFSLAGQLAEEQAIWQLHVPAQAQGRVFSFRRMITWMALPASYLVAGPLADFIFEPLVQHSTTYSKYLGWLTGTAPGRGMALEIALSGMGMAFFLGYIHHSNYLGSLEIPSHNE